MKPVIFLTTGVSGTGSMLRIFRALIGNHIEYAHKLPRGEHVEPLPGRFIYCNTPQQLSLTPRFDPTAWRWLINLRDPRDWMCNQFFWAWQHPVKGGAPAHDKAVMLAKGMDAFCDKHKVRLEFFRLFFEASAQPDALWNTYALFCLHPSMWLDRFQQWMNLPALTREQRAVFEENTTALEANAQWVGTNFAGCDCAPGRHRHELARDSAKSLTDYYQPVLELLRRHDHPLVKATYDE